MSNKTTSIEIWSRVIIVFLTLNLPCYYLEWFSNLPFWGYILIQCAAVAILPYGNPITLGIWIWGFIIAVQYPIDFRSVLLFIFFPLYILSIAYNFIIFIGVSIYAGLQALFERIRALKK